MFQKPPAAVYGTIGSDTEGCVVGAQKRDDAGDFIHFAESIDSHSVRQILFLHARGAPETISQ